MSHLINTGRRHSARFATLPEEIETEGGFEDEPLNDPHPPQQPPRPSLTQQRRRHSDCDYKQLRRCNRRGSRAALHRSAQQHSFDAIEAIERIQQAEPRAWSEGYRQLPTATKGFGILECRTAAMGYSERHIQCVGRCEFARSQVDRHPDNQLETSDKPSLRHFHSWEVQRINYCRKSFPSCDVVYFDKVTAAVFAIQSSSAGCRILGRIARESLSMDRPCHPGNLSHLEGRISIGEHYGEEGLHGAIIEREPRPGQVSYGSRRRHGR